MPGLYIHIPFCIRKCKYCDFNSFSFTAEDKRRYLDALIAEMAEYRGMAADTVFIGGGTPTALTAAELAVLTGEIAKSFRLAPDCEYTVEANPKTLDREKLRVLRHGGVNRISLGVQSFCDAELAAIGRIHTAADACEAAGLVRSCGIDNFSLDLMSALPGQTAESFAHSIEQAIALAPRHISCYSLILEEGTPLCSEYESGLLELPDEDTERGMYEYACRRLEEAGYGQYEISNFAQTGFRSRHNMKYWQCMEYAGLGLSAHSYMGGVRYSNTDDFAAYLSGAYRSGESERLSEADKMSEFMFMGLRMSEGVSRAEFFSRFGRDMDEIFQKPIVKFQKLDMLKEENGRIFLTRRGISLSNQVMCEFLV